MLKFGAIICLLVLTLGYLDYRIQGPLLADRYMDSHSVPGQSPKGMDFYYAFLRSTALRARIVSAIQDPAGDRPPVVNRSVYPPAFMLAIVPFTFMTDIHAYQAYCVVLLVFFYAAFFAALSEGSGPQVGASYGIALSDRLALAVAASAVVLQTYPGSFAFERGNSDIVAAAFAAFTLLAISRHSMIAAAFLLAVSTNVKLYPAILAVLLFLRFRWKGIAWFAGFTAAMLLVIGIGGVAQLTRRLSGVVASPYLWTGNHSVRSLVHQLGTEGAIAPSLELVVSRTILAALGAVLVTAAFRAQRARRGPLSGAEIGICGMCFMLTSLVPVSSHDYQLVVQAVPFLLLLSRPWNELCASRSAAYAVTAIVAVAMGVLFLPLYTILPLRLGGVTSGAAMMKTPALLVAFTGYAWLGLAGVDAPAPCRPSHQ